MHHVTAFFHNLYQQTGINLTILYDPFDMHRFAHGMLTTVELFIICAILSVVIGLLGAAFLSMPYKVPKAITKAYVAFFRNTPALIQLYFFYFGIGAMMPQVKGQYGLTVPLIDNFTWALIALSLYAGAFNVEIIRSGVEAVHKSITEAATALGYSYFATFIHIVAPLAWRISLPALTNNMIELLKTTTLAYAIGVPELLYVSNQIWSDELNTYVMMNVLLVVYLFLVGIVALFMQRWERALRLPGFGAAS